MIARHIRHLVTVAALTAATTLTACAPLEVHSFTARGDRLNSLRTYRWADDAARSTGDPRLDSNPFFERRLKSDAERELATLGFQLVPTGPTDLVLHYHASVTQNLDVGTVDRMLGVCDGCSSQTMYDAGTLMLDLVDVRNNTLVWRGWSESSFDGMVDNQAWLEEHIDKAVARIVATLPRRS